MSDKLLKLKGYIRKLIREELELYKQNIMNEVAAMILLSEERVRRLNNSNNNSNNKNNISDFDKSMRNLKSMSVYNDIVNKIGYGDDGGNGDELVSVNDILKNTEPLNEDENISVDDDALVNYFIKRGVKERFDEISKRADKFRESLM